MRQGRGTGVAPAARSPPVRSLTHSLSVKVRTRACRTRCPMNVSVRRPPTPRFTIIPGAAGLNHSARDGRQRGALGGGAERAAWLSAGSTSPPLSVRSNSGFTAIPLHVAQDFESSGHNNLCSSKITMSPATGRSNPQSTNQRFAPTRHLPDRFFKLDQLLCSEARHPRVVCRSFADVERSGCLSPTTPPSDATIVKV